MKAKSALALALGICLAAPAARAAWQNGLLEGDIGAGNDWQAIGVSCEKIVPDPVAATNITSIQNHVWVYKGQINLPGKCWFAEGYDDKVLLTIDGTKVIDNGWWTGVTFGSIDRPAGWYDFELRLYNGGGLGGPYSDKDANPTEPKCSGGFLCGFGMCTNGTKPNSMAECFFPSNSVNSLIFRSDDGNGFVEEGLLIAVSPEELAVECTPAAGWTTGLTEDREVVCSASAAFFRQDNGTHYACTGFTVATNTSTTLPTVWAEATNAAGVEYTYRHGATSGKITWNYAPDGYLLTTSVEPAIGGTITRDIEADLSDGCYTTNKEVKLTAEPAPGFAFIGWTDNGTSIGDGTAPLTVTMERVHDVKAVFEPLVFAWNGGAENGSWTNGGPEVWLDADGNSVAWANGAIALFTNGQDVTAEIAPEGVSAAEVRFNGSKPVTFTGGTLTMLYQARISAMNAGDIHLGVPVAGTDGLTLASDQDIYRTSFPGFLTKEYQRIFPGVHSNDIIRVNARMGGKNVNNKIPLPAAAYHVTTNGDGTVSVQFQAYDDKYVKCVKVVFRNGDDGVYAKAVWAKYKQTSCDDLGMNFESGGSNGTLVSSPDAGGYGILGLSAEVSNPRIVVAGTFVIGRPAVFTGKLTLECGRLEFEGDGRLGPDGLFKGEVVNDGVIVTPAGWQFFDGKAGGVGQFLVGGAAGARAAYVDALNKGQEEYTVVATNGSLAALTAAGGFTGATDFGNAYKNAPYTFTGFETNSATNIAVHLQIYEDGGDNNRHTKGARIQLYERPGGKIVAVHDCSYYYANTNRIGSFPGGDAPQPNTTGNYEVRRLHLSFGGAAGARFENAVWTGGLTVSNGGAVAVATSAGLPFAGRIEAAGGGEILCYSWTGGNNPALPGGTNPVHLRDGGVLDFAGPQVFSAYNGTRQIFIENGGFIRPYAGDGDCHNYLNHLDVLNGGTVLEGPPFKIGYNKQNAILKVRGNAPCLQMAGYRFCGESTNSAETLTLDVEDVTSNADPDLVISGNIITDPALHDLKTVKTGAGTAVYSGRNSHNGPTSIDRGTLRFETDHAMQTNAPIVLNGAEGAVCTLDVGTNRNNVGTLTLTQKGGTLKLGEGGTIEFAASGALGWEDGAELTIEGAFGPRTVRFGTDKNGLTPEQLKKIKLADWLGISLHLDADGWLNPAGTVISIIR